MALGTKLGGCGTVEPEAGQRPAGSGSGTRARLEVAAVVATGGLHLVCTEIFHTNGLFILVAMVAWGTYVAMCFRKDRTVIKLWGFSKDNLGPTASASSIVASLAILAMAILASHRGSLSFHWHMVPLLLLYPVWGITQQFLILAVAARNLDRLGGGLQPPGLRYWIVSIISGVLFGIVHLPNVMLMAGTFLMGLVFTPLYLKWRNLWPLGIYHGWLGVFAYFWLFNRDPLVGLFGP